MWPHVAPCDLVRPRVTPRDAVCPPRDEPMPPPPCDPMYVLYVARAFSTLEGIGLSVDEDYAIVQVWQPPP
eukprot:2879562-Prymnesium_polylepis.1